MSQNDRIQIDETAKYIFSASKPAIIDLITGIFHVPLDRENVEVSLVSGEFISGTSPFSKYLADIVLEIRRASDTELLVHIEIQTGHDSMMDIRMVRYGYLIGESRSAVTPDRIRVITIPHQVVLYLEEDKRITDELTVRIVLPDGKELDYRVLVLKFYELTVEKLKDMNLYLLFPLILMKYRKKLTALSRQKRLNQETFDTLVQEILDEIGRITALSEKYLENGVIDERTKDIILSATIEIYNQLHEKYINDNKVKGKVEKMIESVMQKRYNVGLEEGKTEGIVEGKIEGKKEAMVEIAKNLIMLGMEDSFIVQATGLTLEEIRQITKIQ